MPWPSHSIVEPSLPPHCHPTSDFLFRLSSTFHTCIPTPLALISNALGVLSIFAWLFAQLPQIYKNWSISSTSGLSFFFLVEWCLGDACNLLGAIFTHQASWQVAIGSYYVFVDLCLVMQWLWYEKLRHGRRVKRIWPRGSRTPDEWLGDDMHAVVIDGTSPASALSRRQSEEGGGSAAGKPKSKAKEPARPRIIFRQPTFRKDHDEEKTKNTPGGTTILRVGSSSPMPSPRTVLLIACLVALVQASPMHTTHSAGRELASLSSTPSEFAGTILSWTSTFLYLGSRLPQLIKNWKRQSTAGLSPQLFVAAFCGNLFYSSALVTNPCAWYNFGPFGGHGWTGSHGSDRAHWIAAALPFFLGAAGVLGLDASVGLQFLMYGGDGPAVVVIEEQKGKRWRWRKVSGWMRGWIPRVSEDRHGEQSAMLQGEDRHGEGYGTL